MTEQCIMCKQAVMPGESAAQWPRTMRYAAAGCLIHDAIRPLGHNAVGPLEEGVHNSGHIVKCGKGSRVHTVRLWLIKDL